MNKCLVCDKDYYKTIIIKGREIKLCEKCYLNVYLVKEGQLEEGKNYE